MISSTGGGLVFLGGFCALRRRRRRS